MAHLRPLENHEVDQELREMFTHYENTRGFCPNSVKTMARRPNISKTFGKLNQVILYEGTVPEELKMLVALASSLASGCHYCQSHMTNLSSIYKASDEKNCRHLGVRNQQPVQCCRTCRHQGRAESRHLTQ